MLLRAFLLAIGGAAVWAEDAVLRPSRPIQEFWLADGAPVPVGGHSVVGVGCTPGASGADPERLLVFLPRPSQRFLCVSVRSLDGRYDGNAEYVVEGALPGAYRLEWKPKNARALKRYKAAEVAVLARIQSSCEPLKRSGNIAVATWDAKESSPATSLYLNVKEADALSVKECHPERGCTEIGQCRPAAATGNGPALAYNRQCDVSLSAGVHSLQIETRNFDNVERSTLAVERP